MDELLSHDHDTDNEIELPPNVPTASVSSSLHPSKGLPSAFVRKRTWDPDDAFANSSDPAVFSSDDHQSGSVEDYAMKRRRKHKWKGTWWGEKANRSSFNNQRSHAGLQLGSSKPQRKFERNYDSGIFMGSEGTDTSFDDVFLEETKQQNGSRGIVSEGPPLGDLIQQQHDTAYDAENPRALVGKKAELDAHCEGAKAIIQQCLEDGDETIDLSSLSVTSEAIPNHLLSPLRAFTKIPSIHEPPASQEAYESLEPQLRIFLSNNILTTVPSELFNLSNLVVLSLRQNRLTEIPAAIGRLTNLTELNVGSNQLEVLPWEILQMMRSCGSLWKFNAFPNPFRRFQKHEIIDSSPFGKKKQYASSGVVRIRSLLRTKSIARRVARSAVTFFDKNGMLFRLPAATYPKRPQEQNEGLVRLHSTRSRVPSLIELSLRATTQLPYFSDLVCEVETPPGDSTHAEHYGISVPENLSHLLSMASYVVEAGGQTCPTCGRPFVIPQAEWIEWWDLNPDKVTSKDWEQAEEAEMVGKAEAMDGRGADASSRILGPDSSVTPEHDEEAADRYAIEEGNAASEETTTKASLKRPFSNVVPFRKRVCSWNCIDH